MEWGDPWSRPRWPTHKATWWTAHTMELSRQGKWFGSYQTDWCSAFKASCLAVVLTGILSALDLYPVMGLWRERAAPAGEIEIAFHHKGTLGFIPVQSFVSLWSPAGPWCRVQPCRRRPDRNVVTREQLSGHIWVCAHIQYNTQPKVLCVCVCRWWWLAWADEGLSTDGSNNDQIALVMETAQFVMAS